MVPLIEAAAERRSIGANVYYGWVVLGVSALAMVGTLPGRTQGLGLITEPLLADLGVDRVRFAQINLVATLIGSLMCFGIGGLVDRRGSRIVLTTLALLLGGVVIAMAGIESAAMLLVLITLTRGLGQSALSVVSLAMPGKWFRRRLTWAMGVFALVTSVGFMLAFPAVGALVLARGWRVAWAAIGVALIFGLAPLAWLFVRREPESERRVGSAVRLARAESPRRPMPRWAARFGRLRSGSSASRARCTASSPRASGCSTNRFSRSAALRRMSTTRPWPSLPSRASPAISSPAPGPIGCRSGTC